MTVKARKATTSPRRTPSGPRTCSRSGCCPGSTTGRPRGRCGSWQTKFAAKPDIMQANIAAFQAGWITARPPRSSRSSTRSSPRPCRPAPTATSPATQPSPTGWSAAQALRPAAVPRVVPDHPRLRHPARAVEAQAVRYPHVPGRRRDQRRGRGARRGVRRRPRRHHHIRTRHVPQGRNDRPGGRRGTPADRLRHPASGPSTGMPTKTEQADLLTALYGRNGESPVAVLAPATPSDSVDTALEATGSRSNTARR